MLSGRADVDPEALRATAQGLDKTVEELADKVDTHMRAVRAFIGPEWSGTAASSHETPWTDWENAARRVIGSFATDADALRTTATGFLTTDNAHAQAITRTGSSLNLPGI
ncbi:WXG100 family type VII secretion target [Nocardia alni]|uniref:WXG100 family type VII secretion target n=1 Tax=Nocardia alni TaxID=2815723 RepID=UPI001C246AE7|nr:WXG100 family type VII secretion target [Nocardia alni]